MHVPDFGESTRSLLRETAVATPRLDAVLDAFLRELGSVPGEASALVFDDFHLVDDSSDVRLVVHELLTRAPERMSFVFASRREPPVRLARLRALGEVAELGTNDLRFDSAETERLFRETYEMRLEPTVLAELGRRTEGWAASLQLVRAALNDRDAAGVRAFISSLSGAEGHLYDYLAEEVVGDLPADLQQFLMRTSVLDVVDLRLGPVAAGVSVDEARELIDRGERHGLFGKGGAHSRGSVRAHPLVRDFLQARLLRNLGQDAIKAIRLRVAAAAESFDWQVAARHYLAAGSEAEAQRVLVRSIEAILAAGAYAAAQEIALALPSRLPGAAGLVLESRLAQQRGATTEGLHLAEEAFASDPESQAALVNLVAARSFAGDVEGAVEASRFLADAPDSRVASIGRAFGQMIESSVDGSLEDASRELERQVAALRGSGEDHYLGVTLLNLAQLLNAVGDFDRALEASEEAVRVLSTSSGGAELLSAQLARASTLAYVGRIGESRSAQAEAVRAAPIGHRLELAAEIGQTEALLGEPGAGWVHLTPVVPLIDPASDMGEQALMARAYLRTRTYELEQAFEDVSEFRHGSARSTPAFEARRWLARGLVLALLDREEAIDAIRTGRRIATEQGAQLLSTYGSVMETLAERQRDPSSSLLAVAEPQTVVLSMLAELILARLAELSVEAFEAVRKEARSRPWRWLGPSRRLLANGNQRQRRQAAVLLSEIGQPEDVHRLRDAGRSMHDRDVGRFGLELARRLAPRVLVSDLGRVAVLVGDRVVEGADVRRKVLALLCLLISKPRFASTREEVIDSLWPDQDPAGALNSLNQTVYFLRRVFEPVYTDETSPGYVGQDGETIWLDSELITSTSRRCLTVIRDMPDDPSAGGSLELAKLYTARWALDFAYEDWASSYRDALHTAYLRVIEHAVRNDLDAGQFARGTFLAERAAEVDPDADEIKISLVRLYRLSGAHAAAAEQYQHYAVSMRELGVEPTSFSELVSG